MNNWISSSPAIGNGLVVFGSYDSRVYALDVRQGAIIAMRAKDVFGTLLAVGITSSLGIQAFINIGVSLGLIPTTGVTLPFLSYGGTSMIVSMGMIGVLLNILNQSGKEEIR